MDERPLFRDLMRRRHAEVVSGTQQERRRARVEALRPQMTFTDQWLDELPAQTVDRLRRGLEDFTLDGVIRALVFCRAYLERLEEGRAREQRARRDAIVECLRAGVPVSVIARGGVSKTHVGQVAREEGIATARMTRASRDAWELRFTDEPPDADRERIKFLIGRMSRARTSLDAYDEIFSRLRALRWIWMASANDHRMDLNRIGRFAGRSPQQVRKELAEMPNRIRALPVLQADIEDACELAAMDPLCNSHDSCIRILQNMIVVLPATTSPQAALLALVVLTVDHGENDELAFDVAHRLATHCGSEILASTMLAAQLSTAWSMPIGTFHQNTSLALLAADQPIRPETWDAWTAAGARWVRAALRAGEHRGSEYTEIVLFALAGRHRLDASDPDLRSALLQAISDRRLTGPAAFCALSAQSPYSTVVRVALELAGAPVFDNPWLLAFATRYYPHIAFDSFDAHRARAREVAANPEAPPPTRLCAALLGSGWPPDDESIAVELKRSRAAMEGRAPPRQPPDRYAALAARLIREQGHPLRAWPRLYDTALDLLDTESQVAGKPAAESRDTE